MLAAVSSGRRACAAAAAHAQSQEYNTRMQHQNAHRKAGSTHLGVLSRQQVAERLAIVLPAAARWVQAAM